jgi:hypothetical protein
MATQKLRIKIRRDESTNWEEVNPLLYVGEQGYETDTRKMKIGDGLKRYNELEYFGETLESIDGFLITSKVHLEHESKFLIKTLKNFDDRELTTQKDANVIIVETLLINEQYLDTLDERVKIIEEGGIDSDLFVKKTGDTITGSFNVIDENGYSYNINPDLGIESGPVPVGYVSITKDGDIKYHSYLMEEENKYIIDVLDSDSANALPALTLDAKDVTVGRDLTVYGRIYSSGVDILDALSVTEKVLDGFNSRLGMLDFKYDKTGGPIFGPVVVIPSELNGSLPVFVVNAGGVFCMIEPTSDKHVATKFYVDSTTLPNDISKLKTLNSIRSFLG